MKSERLKKIWKARDQIYEGVKNSVFIKAEVENLAKERNEICLKCESYDSTGEGCEFPGTQPCCSKLTGGCGCSLHLKHRSLSSGCPKGYWDPVMTEEEENQIPT